MNNDMMMHAKRGNALNQNKSGGKKKVVFRGRHKRQESIMEADELFGIFPAPMIQEQHDMLLAEIVRSKADKEERIRLMRAICRIYSLDGKYADDFFRNFCDEHTAEDGNDDTVLLYDYLLQALTVIHNCCGNNDTTIKRVETTLVAAWAVFKYRNDMTAVSLHVVQYAMSLLPRSVTGSLVKCIRAALFYETEQSLADDILKDTGGDCGHSFRNLLNKPFVSHARIIASLLCTIGLVQPSCWHVKGFEIFAIQAFDERRTNMIDVMDSTLSSIIFFFKQGYQCFCKKSMRPLFVTSDKMLELEIRVEDLSLMVKNHVQGSCRQDFAVLCGLVYDLADDIRAAQLNVKPIEVVICRKLLRTALALENDIILTQKSETLRIAPYCVKTWGTSGVGKTSFNLITVREILRYNGFSFQDTNIKKIEPEKEYWENIRNDTTGITIDDMCNTIHTKEKINPADILIKLVNNQPQSVNRADIPDKGKIWLDAKAVGITTNNRTLSAENWSVEPMSVVRRCNLHIDIRVKDEFADANGQLDSRKAEKATRHGYIEDLWNISVFTVKKKHNSKLANMAEDYDLWLVNDDLGEMKNIGIERYLRFLYNETKKHFAMQRAFIEKQRLDESSFSCCSDCNMIEQWCQCTTDDEPIVKEEQSFVADYFYNQYFIYLMSFLNVSVIGLLSNWFYHYSGIAIWLRVTSYIYASLFPTWWERKVFEILSKRKVSVISRNIILSIDNFIDFNISVLPSFITNHKYFEYAYVYWHRRCIYNQIRYSFIVSFCILLFCVGWQHVFARWTTIYIFIFCIIYLCIYICISSYFTYMAVYRRLQHVRSIGVGSRFNTWKYTDYIDKDNFFSVTGFVHNAAVFAILYTTVDLIRLGIRLYTSQNKVNEHQGGVLSPGTVEEAERREVKTNIWAHTIQTSNKSTRQIGDFVRTCSKNLVVVKITSATTKNGIKEMATYCNAIMLVGNVVMMPLHMVYERDGVNWVAPYITAKLTFVRSEMINSGWSEEVVISTGIRIEGYDLIVFRVNGGGIFKDITDLITIKPSYAGQVVVVKRELTGKIEECPGNVRKQEMMNYTRDGLSMNWHGVHVQTSRRDWAPGDCMSLILSNDADPRIIGFHLIGTSDISIGISASIPTSQLKGILHKLPEQFVVHSAEDVATTIYDVDLQFSSEIHRKSPVNFVEERNFSVLGSVFGGRTPKTKVRESIATPFLEKKLGPQLYSSPPYGGPNGKQSWYSWWLNLDGTSRVSTYLPEREFKMALKDYEEGLYHVIDIHKNKIKPLDEETVVNGMPNSRFMTPLNRDTSMGYPLGKPKIGYMEVVRIEPDGRRIYAFNDPRIWKRWYDMEEELANFKIPTSIFKATMKDEPVKKTKEKVRIFQAADIGMQLGVRKYFLPIIRALCLHPLDSECAVGINPFSLEWDALDGHVSKFGRDRIIAGDYKGWDTTLPSVLVREAAYVLVHFAERTGNYSHRDIIIMRGLAIMLANPLINFNGTLIRLHGTTPSGHNLTSVLNSICNSILLRCAFYKHFMYEPHNFREFVANITYGDDFVASVAPGKDFSLVTYENYLSTYTGIKVTMPDKKSDIVPYMQFDNVDFLKRRSVYIESIGHRIGVLDISSIHKSLYTTMASPGDEANVLIAVVHSAMHELFYHGKEVYEKYISLFKEMFEYVDLDPGPIYKSYEERAYEWKQSYEKSVVLDDGRVDETLATGFEGIAHDTT
jgi:hypothetical protein